MAMPLHAASAGGHETVVKLLLGREDLQTNLKDNLGRTPLLWAGAKGRDNVVKLLLAKRMSITKLRIDTVKPHCCSLQEMAMRRL